MSETVERDPRAPLTGEQYMNLMKTTAARVAKWPAWKRGESSRQRLTLVKCQSCGDGDCCDKCQYVATDEVISRGPNEPFSR
jgi:hypothetical protein